MSVRLRRRDDPRRARGLHCTELELAAPNVLPAHDGLTIAHLSDLHVASRRAPRALHHAVRLANAAKPDLVALTGDYVCFSAKRLDALRRALEPLSGPVVAVLGNHDHWTDPDAVQRALETLGITVLRNAHQTLMLRGEPFHVVGLDDNVTRNADVARAFESVPAHGTRLALSHDPNAADSLTDLDAALVLAGHTHGGQVRLPGITALLAKRAGLRYLAGLYDVKGMPLYVSRGLGQSVPLRIGARPELGLLRLRRAQLRLAI